MDGCDGGGLVGLQLYPPVSGHFHRSVIFENFFQAQLSLSKEPTA